jgi:hypothetical protein
MPARFPTASGATARTQQEHGLLSKRERICRGTERRYGAGGEEMATSSLH